MLNNIDRISLDEQLFVELTPQQAASCCGGAYDYGSIAYSPSTGVYGFSNLYNSATAAIFRSIDECEKASGKEDCLQAGWIKNGWISLAVASNKENFRGRTGLTKTEAETKALNACKNSFGSDCKTIVTLNTF